MNTKAQSLLSLIHLSSPALPVGAFAYSQGLEYALDIGWLKRAEDVQAWIEQGLATGFGQLDLPIYVRTYSAWKKNDAKAVQYWNDTLLAFRETKELYLEDIQVGSAYQQWHLGLDAARQTQLDLVSQPTVVTMNSLAAVYDEIAIDDALLGFAWAWCENQIACASKAMPMGQTQGQQILKALIPTMVEVCEKAQATQDDEIGTGLFSMAMASSLHEHQYSRLFRS